MCRLRRVCMAWLLLAFGATAPHATLAGPKQSECSGILHQTRDGLVLGGGRGEDEGICVIRKADSSRVLAVCRIGARCVVKGTIGDCKDSGECAEVTKISGVRKR